MCSYLVINIFEIQSFKYIGKEGKKMKLKKQIAILTLFLMFSCLFFGGTAYVSAASDMDGVGQQSEQSGGEDYNSSVSDYLKNRDVIGDKEMQKANSLASPLVSVIGTIAGFITLVASAAIFAITALDLLYIGVPVTRTYLAPSGDGGGMGMGMGGMGGQQQQQGRQWVSDEALQSVQAAGSGATGGSPMGGMGGMGMGGMGSMGGMGNMGGQQQQNTKSVIITYFKKRVFFIVIFAVCTIVLTSSIVTDCGINLGKLFLKITAAFSGNVEGYAAS